MRTAKQQRNSLRLQLGNQHDYQFLLLDSNGHQQAGFCVCVDISAVGATFIVDREIPLNTNLVLHVIRRDIQIETLPVTVVRANSELNEEERFCCVVRFDEIFENYGRLATDIGEQIAA